MMKQNLIFLFALTFGLTVNGQSIEELYLNNDYEKLIEYADTETLTKEECYYIGYAFFQLEDDAKAIKMYDRAIKQGLNEDYIYLFKGLSLRYSKQYQKAIDNFRIAIRLKPDGQKNYTELGNCYLYQEQYDSALVYYYKARKLSYVLGDAYLRIPYIYHLKEDYKKALEEYQLSAELISKQDPKYIEILRSIGQLEYTVFMRYENAAKAYSEMISLAPQDYDHYPKLVKAYYANEQYEKGESVFQKMKEQYDKGLLPKDYQDYGSAPIAEFDWNGQNVVVYRYFKVPEEILGIMYKIYLIGQDGESVERTLMTEKTLKLEEGGAKHLLCERDKDGTHHTYMYGWPTDDINFESLKTAVLKVLDQKRPQASSKVVKQKKKKKRK